MRWLFYVFLISIPLGTRVLLHQFTNGFHEYEAAFLYLSDAFLILLLTLFVLYAFFRQIRAKTQNTGTRRLCFVQAVFCVFVITSGISVFLAPSFGLAVYSFARLVMMVLLAYAVAHLMRSGVVTLKGILGVLAGGAVFQALLGIVQFLKQSHAGLKVLGEPVLATAIPGVANIAVEGAKVLRAYGTFPHPNVLAAFLLLGLLSLYYLWTSHVDRKVSACGVLILMGTALVALGLVLTFSRAAWVVGAGALLGVIAFSLRTHFRQAVRLAFFMAALGVILIVAFAPYILPRARVAQNEPAVVQRLAYNEMAVRLIAKNPLGIGIGNQVLHSVRTGTYQQFGMREVWQWQPIHNLYLLIGVEVGVAGVLVFLVFVGVYIIRNSAFMIPRVMLASLLLLGLFDHYLWTLQQGRLMLWLTIGIVMAGVSSRPRS